MARTKSTAGAFDIRTVIGGLLGAYGVILTVMGLAGAGDNGTGFPRANLWAGLVMLAVGAIFVAWARLRPVRVPEGAASDGDGERPSDAGGH